MVILIDQWADKEEALQEPPRISGRGAKTSTGKRLRKEASVGRERRSTRRAAKEDRRKRCKKQRPHNSARWKKQLILGQRTVGHQKCKEQQIKGETNLADSQQAVHVEMMECKWKIQDQKKMIGR